MILKIVLSILLSVVMVVVMLGPVILCCIHADIYYNLITKGKCSLTKWEIKFLNWWDRNEI